MSSPAQPTGTPETPGDTSLLGQLQVQTGELVDRIIESQLPGTIGPNLVKACGVIALTNAVRTGNPDALKAYVLGVSAGTIGNTVNSLYAHRQAAHGSIRTKPGVASEALRAVTDVMGGTRMRAVPMHRWHHKYADTESDYHAPSVVGRGKVFRGIVGISGDFPKQQPEYTAAVLNESIYTSERPYERTPVFLASALAFHMAVGKKLGMPVPYRLASFGLHVAMIYANNAMFTADVHSDDPATTNKIRKFSYGRVMNIMFGSENGHEEHHADPSNPQHSEFDLVYGIAVAMRKMGLADIPYLDKQERRSSANRG